MHSPSFAAAPAPRRAAFQPGACRRAVCARPRPSLHPAARPRPRMTAATPGGDSAGPVAGRIARAFVTACAPGQTPYAEAVRDFCRTGLEAYVAGYSLPALRVALASTAPERALASDEAELRDVWLSLVYKTLRAVGVPSAERSDALTVPDKFDEFVRGIIDAVRQGYDLKRIQLEQALRDTGGEQRTTLESAILNQSTRLVIATLELAQPGGAEGD